MDLDPQGAMFTGMEGGGEQAQAFDDGVRASVRAATLGGPGDDGEGDGCSAALEAEVARLRERVRDLERDLAAKDEAMDALELRQRIEREAARAGAVDLEAAALLTLAAIEGSGDAEVEAVVAELRASRPYLFGGAAAPGGSPGARVAPSMSASEPGAGLASAAEEAMSSGDRRALMRYLRMRRASV